jgi:hypothetical protein
VRGTGAVAVGDAAEDVVKLPEIILKVRNSASTPSAIAITVFFEFSAPTFTYA